MHPTNINKYSSVAEFCNYNGDHRAIACLRNLKSPKLKLHYVFKRRFKTFEAQPLVLHEQ